MGVIAELSNVGNDPIPPEETGIGGHRVILEANPNLKWPSLARFYAAGDVIKEQVEAESEVVVAREAIAQRMVEEAVRLRGIPRDGD